MLIKNPNETDAAFQRRVVTGKLIDGTLADEDYCDLAELVYGKTMSSDHCRKMFYGLKEYIEAEQREEIAQVDDSDAINKIEMATLELKKERIKLTDQRTSFNRLLREQARYETTKEIIQEAAKNVQFPKLSFIERPNNESENTMLISLSDLHIGATIDNYWNKYDSDIAADRLEEYFERIEKINRKEKCKTATVYANGDIVSGIIHQALIVSSKENLIQQVMIASELISQFLDSLTSVFDQVNFCSVAGNHSRLGTKKDSPLTERADDLVQFYLEARLQTNPRINFDYGKKIDSTIHLFEVGNKNFAVVHGDMDSESKLEALQKFCGVDLYAVLTGHMHHFNIRDCRGIKMIMSGSLMGTDDFTIEKRIYGKPSQAVTICNADGIECYYNIEFL